MTITYTYRTHICIYTLLIKYICQVDSSTWSEPHLTSTWDHHLKISHHNHKDWNQDASLFQHLPKRVLGTNRFCYTSSGILDPQPTSLGYNGGLERRTTSLGQSHIRAGHTQKVMTTPAKESHPGENQRLVRQLQLLDTNQVTPCK